MLRHWWRNIIKHKHLHRSTPNSVAMASSRLTCSRRAVSLKVCDTFSLQQIRQSAKKNCAKLRDSLGRPAATPRGLRGQQTRAWLAFNYDDTPGKAKAEENTPRFDMNVHDVKYDRTFLHIVQGVDVLHLGVDAARTIVCRLHAACMCDTTIKRLRGFSHRYCATWVLTAVTRLSCCLRSDIRSGPKRIFCCLRQLRQVRIWSVYSSSHPWTGLLLY